MDPTSLIDELRPADLPSSTSRPVSPLGYALSRCPNSARRPSYFEAKASVGFLDLPGEVRNRIYRYVFEPKEIAIHWLTPDKDLTFLMQKSSLLTFEPAVWKCLQYRKFLSQRPSRLSVKGRKPSEQSKAWENKTPASGLLHRLAAILLTCRQVNAEASLMFYSSHAFHFYSPETIRKFLSSVSLPSKSAIRKLRVHYSPTEAFYPSRDNNHKYGEDMEWLKLCHKLLLHMQHLKELTICFDVPLDGLPAFWRPASRHLNPWLTFADGRLNDIHVYSNHEGELAQASIAVIQDLLRIKLVGWVSGGTGHLKDDIAYLEECQPDRIRSRAFRQDFC